MNRRLVFAACFICLALAAIALPIATLQAQSGAPASPPDAANGLAIFGERCANCHGDTGAGDGPLAENLDTPPQQLNEAAFYNAITPGAIFDQVTNGDMAAGMPGFGPGSNSNPLSEAQRWDAVAAVYSLGFDVEARAEAGALYSAGCAECHGESGDADEFDLTDPLYWVDQSNETVLAATAVNGAHDALALDPADLMSTVRYARTFAFPAADVAAASGPMRLTTAVISGIVTNGTVPDQIPVGATATLLAFADFQVAETFTTTVSASGHYTFTMTDVDPAWVFLASVDYQEVAYTSNVAQLSTLQPRVSLPITVFEPTRDVAVVSIERLHVVVGFAEGRVEVAELYIFTNDSDRVYVGATGDPEAGTVNFNLPTGAENVAFERGLGDAGNFLPAGEDVIQTDAGWADTLPLRPGASSLTLLIRYTLPYDNDLTVAHPVNYDVKAVTLVMNDVGVELETDGAWLSEGAQVFGDVTMVTFTREAFGPGTPLTFNLSGEPTLPAAAVGGAIAGNSNTQLLLGAFGLIAAGGIAFFAVRQWRASADDVDEEDQESLLQAIAELDDDYAAGDIAAGPYQREREELLADLLDIWDEDEA